MQVIDESWFVRENVHTQISYACLFNETHCLLCLKASALFKMYPFVLHVRKKVMWVNNVNFQFWQNYAFKQYCSHNDCSCYN